MSKPIQPPPPTPAAGVPADKSASRRSGRVQFDERGHAVWAWAVQTGMFDSNASTQRVRALSESTVKLEIAEAPKQEPPSLPKGAPLTPYERAPARPARGAASDPKGSDPYSRGAARSPETMTFNPYERTPTRKR